MSEFKITGPILKDMMLNAAAYLEKNKEGLDALNVFPVPDGDTGTNMSLTMRSAVCEIKDDDEVSVEKVASAVSMGALKGARGNSGVILSQIFRGFAKGMEGVTEADAGDFANAIDLGAKSAYKAVMKPREGTILTIAREMGECALKYSGSGAGISDLMQNLLEHAEDILLKTPDMLPVLKEAGVVDAGGKGLLLIYYAFKMSMDGDEIDFDFDEITPQVSAGSVINEDIEFGYCTEFFIKNLFEHIKEDNIDRLRDKLMTIGDCVLVVGDLNLVKVHVHTNMPGKALQIALRYGMLSGIKIDNMREQHNEIIGSEQKETAVIAVSSGDGLKAIFKDFLVDYIVEGGQTMNPSAEDIARAIAATNAKNVIVLPNNKNIILAAEQAKDLVKCNVFVVHSTTIPQGIAATLKFNPDLPVEENYRRMNEAIKNVKSGQITKAVRVAKVNGHEIEKDDFMGIFDGDIVVHNKERKSAVIKLLQKMISEDDCVITIFYGKEISEETADKVAKKVSSEFPNCDLEIQSGGQPVYDYIISVE